MVCSRIRGCNESVVSRFQGKTIIRSPKVRDFKGDQHTIAEDSWHWVDKEVLRIQIISIENDRFYHIFYIASIIKTKVYIEFDPLYLNRSRGEKPLSNVGLVTCQLK